MKEKYNDLKLLLCNLCSLVLLVEDSVYSRVWSFGVLILKGLHISILLITYIYFLSISGVPFWWLMETIWYLSPCLVILSDFLICFSDTELLRFRALKLLFSPLRMEGLCLENAFPLFQAELCMISFRKSSPTRGTFLLCSPVALRSLPALCLSRHIVLTCSHLLETLAWDELSHPPSPSLAGENPAIRQMISSSTPPHPSQKAFLFLQEVFVPFVMILSFILPVSWAWNFSCPNSLQVTLFCTLWEKIAIW